MSRTLLEARQRPRSNPLLLAALAFLLVAARVDAAPFTVVMLPDVQHYNDSAVNEVRFREQTQWIVDNLAAQDIAFVTAVGDLVQSGANVPIEWSRADAAMDTLDGDLGLNPDGLVPYAAVAGNRDFDTPNNKSSALEYLANFGPSRYAGRSWFVGASSNQINMSQIFESDGPGSQEYLSLGLEWLPSDAAIAWAQSVLAAHPTLPAIVTTHECVDAAGAFATAGQTPSGGGNNDAESVYRKLIEPYPQVFLVLCGHISGDGLHMETTILGRPIYEVLADYQSDPNGGNGWMPVIEFRPDTSEIDFRSFSDFYVAGVTAGQNRALNASSNYTLSFDLNAHADELWSTPTLHFRQGQDHGFGLYTSALDTHVGDGSEGETSSNAPHGTLDTLITDGDGDNEQALLRFDALVGNGPGQIPPGRSIEQAILTLTTEGASSESGTGARFHRMLVPWDENSTWDGLVGGVQLVSEASSAYDADSAGSVTNRGTDSFDVTASVQAWVDGAPNLGWVALPNGNDSWRFRSSEWSTVAERPMLTVRLSTEAVPTHPGPALPAVALLVSGALWFMRHARTR